MYSQVVSLARASLADDDKIEISIELKMSKKAKIKYVVLIMLDPSFSNEGMKVRKTGRMWRFQSRVSFAKIIWKYLSNKYDKERKENKKGKRLTKEMMRESF